MNPADRNSRSSRPSGAFRKSGSIPGVASAAAQRISGLRNRSSSPLVKRQSREVAVEDSSSNGPAQLSIPMLLLMLVIGGGATTFGLKLVHTRFQTKDYQMESARLQTLSRGQNDDIQTLETQLGGMVRDSSLREAATGPLGLIEPPNAVVTGLTIDRSEQVLFEQIEGRNQARIRESRENYLSIRADKEDQFF